MPRFTLRQFSPTDYRGSLPERDPNNAIWPRISAFAKMLHDISWEDDDGPTEDELRLASDDASESMEGYTPETDDELTKGSELMKGYKPNTEEQDRQNELDDRQRIVNGNLTGGHRNPVDMERMKALSDYLDQMDWDAVRKEKLQSEMEGYRPLPTR